MRFPEAVANGSANGAKRMSTNFKQAAQHAQEWVNDLAEDLGWDERRAYHLLRQVLPTLRDWLQPEEMADLAAQLPVLIRGIFFEAGGPATAGCSTGRRRTSWSASWKHSPTTC
jgi:uncharacterized protein (DUF2267 family)